jgi:hypothetical protein
LAYVKHVVAFSSLSVKKTFKFWKKPAYAGFFLPVT